MGFAVQVLADSAMRGINLASVVLIVWFTIQAVILVFLPQSASRLLKDLSPRELRVVGILQLIIVVLLAMAIWKALMVAWYFMHLKFEKNPMRVFAIAPLPLTVIIVIAVLTEYVW